jgi:hypothetical protein
MKIAKITLLAFLTSAVLSLAPTDSYAEKISAKPEEKTAKPEAPKPKPKDLLAPAKPEEKTAKPEAPSLKPAPKLDVKEVPTTRPTIDIKKATPTELAEHILMLFTNGDHWQAIELMTPEVKKTVAPGILGAKINEVFAVTGIYTPKSLKLLKQEEVSEGKTRFIFSVKFKNEDGQVYMVLTSSKQVEVFLIQTPKLIERAKLGISDAPTPKAELMKRLEEKVDNMWKGYNENKADVFCRDCSDEMKKQLGPTQFKLLQKTLMDKYGKYKNRAFFRAQQSKDGHLIILYHGQFEKVKAELIRVVFSKVEEKYKIAGLQLLPY